MTIIYTTAGSVRGCCGHKHHTREDAEQCLADDQAGCQRARGYSDRIILHGEDPGGCLLDDHEVPYRPHGPTLRAAFVDDIGGRL